MNEADLAAKVVIWLNDQHYEVYQEVSARMGVADIVAAMNGRIWVIETKTSLSLSVMQQAHRWIPYAHWASVAVPLSSGGAFSEMVCRKLGIGVVKVSMKDKAYSHGNVLESVAPALNRKAITRFRLVEEQKTFAAAGNGSSHWSPFKQTCKEIDRYVSSHPGCCLKDLVENIQHHYSSRSGARQCISYWIQAGKVPGIRCDRDGRHLRIYRTEGIYE